MYVCLCNALTDRKLKQAAAAIGSQRPGEYMRPVVAVRSAASVSKRCCDCCQTTLGRQMASFRRSTEYSRLDAKRGRRKIVWYWPGGGADAA